MQITPVHFVRLQFRELEMIVSISATNCDETSTLLIMLRSQFSRWI